MAILTGVQRLEHRRTRDVATEPDLVARCRRGDAAAFGLVVEAYQARVLGFVRRMVRDAEDAEDVAQEVFIRAFQGFERFDGRCSLRTWLFRIAYHLCVDRSRRADRQGLVQPLDAHEPDEDAFELADHRWNPEMLSLSSELHEQVEQGIAALSDKLRTVLLLHDREDLSYDDIALAVNVPVGTVKSRLFLARAALQRHLTDYLQEAGS